MITYSLRGEPVARQGVATQSELAALMSEIFVRLVEMEEVKKDAAVMFISRLSSVALHSHRALYPLLYVGSGQIEKIVESYENQAEFRGLTRQALHWQWSQDMETIRLAGFREVARVLQEYRDNVLSHEDAVSPADALRSSTDRDNGGES